MDKTKELIEKLEAARAKTTEGEWWQSRSTVYIGDAVIAQCDRWGDGSENSAFIVTAHNLLPELLEYVKALQAALESYAYSFYRADYQPDRPLFNGVVPTNEALDKAWELLGITRENFSERQRAYRNLEPERKPLPTLTVNDKITGEQVKHAALDANLRRINHHDCGGCGVWVAYEIQGESLYFDSACGCSPYGSPLQPQTWDSAADWINMQTNLQSKIEIAARFGLTLLASPTEEEKGRDEN